MAVLTREREISTCPHHIPALALNSTHLLSENWSRIVSPLLPKPAATQRGSLQMLWMWNPGDRWLQSGYTIQTKRETACGIPGISNLSLLNYLTPKLQKVTHRNEVGGEREEGGLVAEPITLWLYGTTRCRGGKILSRRYMMNSLELDSIQPAYFHMCELMRTMPHLYDKLQLLCAAKTVSWL